MTVLDRAWPPPPPSGVAIGVFDGVHRGHRSVLEGLVDRCAAEGLASGVLTFDPHPVAVLAPGRAPPLLTTVDRRIELMTGLGVDWVGKLDLAAIRMMSPAQFVTEVLVERATTRIVTVGDDFRFGHDRVGDVTELARLGVIHGFEVMAVDLVADHDEVISSTRIRRLLMDGDVAAAAGLLGRPHRLEGEVVHGEARGQAMGYPTANLALTPDIALPADGIYAVRVTEPVAADAVASLGVRPTFGVGGERLLEVHIFDYEGDLYGSKMSVEFVDRLRGEERFDSVDALIQQMEQDSRRARDILAGYVA